jgi:hypothetical protein
MPKSNRKTKIRAKRAKKKVESKKAKKKKVVKNKVAPKIEQPKDIEKTDAEYQNNLRCIKLINAVRRPKNEVDANIAFEQLLTILMPKIQKVVSRFNIPGYDTTDVLQEALYALRYKAIKDYDKERGTGEGPAAFDKFALLCIRRHLATEFKASYQNKKRVLNQSVSIDKETNNNTSHGSENEIYLSNIIADPKKNDVLTDVANDEYYKNLQNILFENLSSFEREVYILYAQKFSYEEIAEKINDKRYKVKVNIKGVDNALSRIKHKAHNILKNYESKDKNI